VILAVAALAGLSVAACVLFRISVSYPVAGSTVGALFGSIALVLIAYRLLNPPGDGLDVEFGAWLGLASAAGVAFGGYLGMQETSGHQAASAG
jgi:hypothetical protein